ncbi:MoaD/ThiS family protein [Methanoculleus chikugoensis]|uniref:MoaD/ThiS family protein n=1 Tax=Methanoculleus chikugoensis TaxID=118126 RepID=UPI0006D1CBB8|nr:MoaD/ThiS family protein [Methanoculleus chikugoensis]
MRRSPPGDRPSATCSRTSPPGAPPGSATPLHPPTGGEIRAYVNILKNGRNIHFSGGLETPPLEDGDTVAFFPPAGGG